MPAVLVHGNPETAAIWGPLIDALDRTDVITLSPPGFGAPTPEGWGATRAEYADWLVLELTAIGEPVDLVGHDWGGGHAMAVAMSRPDLLRTWTTDIIGIFHPDYEWHDMAQIWQQPGVGEEAVAAMAGAPLPDRIGAYEGLGMPTGIALDLAAATDETMALCILGLYRDAAQPVLSEAGADLPAAAARPGLAIVAREDTYVGTEEMARQMAERAGASVTAVDGVGHWWMIQQPELGAAILTGFWDGVAT
ncbi:MAG: alpha/beta hydrolase [Actinomycetota bacterium]